MGHAYGWKPSLPDIRNHFHDFSTAPVKPEVDLRNEDMPEIWNQTVLGSCTAHGSLAGFAFDMALQGGPKNYAPSRLFQYYNSRSLEGTVDFDAGATVADAIKALNKFGAPPEADWPYDTDKFTVKPPAKAYKDGDARQVVKYAQVEQTTHEMQACLSAGLPIVIGFTVYESFESDEVAKTGDVPLPALDEQVLGGHCVLVVGYTKRHGKPVWICRNSWGTGWGDKGYFYMPQSFLTNPMLANDFWTIQSVESPDPAGKPQPKAV